MKKLLFMINPKAGKKKKDYTTDILAVFKNAGYATKIVSTRKRADGTLLAKKYGDRVDLIVCMGGDGTLNEVIEGMLEAHCKTPLGYIPAGSTNDFAASLGLNQDCWIWAVSMADTLYTQPLRAFLQRLHLQRRRN